ncbi:ATP-binding protein [Sneathiella glossodoripedis]|uniref:ATP-binding protein n=1 Tax=Sneathiella glossodoripedis TaxID=418853 RepID=UPI00046F9BF0|nr:ATP-binding protein [Sneathiella glossodoripedis]
MPERQNDQTADDNGHALEHRYVEVMNNFAVDLINIGDEQQLAWYVAKNVVQKLGFADCVVYFYSEETNLLTQIAAIGEKNPTGRVIINHLQIPIGQGVTGKVAQSGQPMLINDLTNCDFYIPDVDPACSELCVPIISEGKTLGVIDSEHPDKGFFNNTHLRTLTLVATLMAARLKLLIKERDLVESDLRNRLIFNASLDGIVTVNEKGKIVESNQAARDMLGYQQSELKGRRAISLLVPAGLQRRYRKQMKDILQRGRGRLLNTRFETWAKRKNGEEFPIEIAIANYRVAEQRFFTGFLRDITAQKQAEIARRRALHDAEKANRTKSVFLATMSHELRTPLNAIIGFSEVLRGEMFGPLGSGRYKEYVEDITISGRHLLTLVNDILDLSAIEANELTMHKQDMHFRNIMHDCSTIIGELAKKKHITYHEILAEDLSLLHADPRAVSQILINLLSNAVKFTPDSGEVTVKIYEEDNQHVICVSDTGPGMDTEQIEALTKPFVRGQSHAHTAMEGSGLGLAIVNSLVGLHDGDLQFESVKGGGTSVFVRLPSRAEG